MSTKPTIMKFGGTSVEDTDAFRNVAAIVKSHLAVHPVIVVSAVAGFTSALLASVAKAIDGDARAATKSLNEYFGRHSLIAKETLSDGPIFCCLTRRIAFSPGVWLLSDCLGIFRIRFGSGEMLNQMFLSPGSATPGNSPLRPSKSVII